MKQVVTLRGTRLNAARERLNAVEARHRELDARLKELGRRMYLTPPEQREAAEIKKYKLKAKDEIETLRKMMMN